MTLNTKLTIKETAYYATEEEWRRFPVEYPGPSPAHGQIEAGEVVDYIAHVPGGMVKARHKGKAIIIHPGCTKELS